MGIFGRGKRLVASKPESADLATLLLQGEEMIGRLAQAHTSWGLGTADRWGLDQRTGIITWTLPDKIATAAAQIIGSYNPCRGVLALGVGQRIRPSRDEPGLARCSRLG